MKATFKCSCGSDCFRIFYSYKKAVCHECLKEYSLDEVLGLVEIKHTRG
jgi:hypothetical protein